MNTAPQSLGIFRRRVDAHGEESFSVACVELGVGPDWIPSPCSEEFWYPTPALQGMLQEGTRLYVVGTNPAGRRGLIGLLEAGVPVRELRKLIEALPVESDTTDTSKTLPGR